MHYFFDHNRRSVYPTILLTPTSLVSPPTHLSHPHTLGQPPLSRFSQPSTFTTTFLSLSLFISSPCPSPFGSWQPIDRSCTGMIGTQSKVHTSPRTKRRRWIEGGRIEREEKRHQTRNGYIAAPSVFQNAKLSSLQNLLL